MNRILSITKLYSKQNRIEYHLLITASILLLSFDHHSMDGLFNLLFEIFHHFSFSRNSSKFPSFLKGKHTRIMALRNASTIKWVRKGEIWERMENGCYTPLWWDKLLTSTFTGSIKIYSLFTLEIVANFNLHTLLLWFHQSHNIWSSSSWLWLIQIAPNTISAWMNPVFVVWFYIYCFFHNRIILRNSFQISTILICHWR